MPTGSAMDRESKQQQVERLERLCHERGLPVTMQRRTVFEMILDREDHPTADQIYDKVRSRIHTISRTTVYRILETLVELRLIARICHPGSAARFDPKTRPHHHLVCLHCETIFDLEDSQVTQVAWPDVRAYGFEIQDHHIHFRGVCATCRMALAKLALRPALRTKPSTAAARRRVKLRSSTKQRRNKT